MTDDFDPVRYRQGLLEARSAAMEYVAHQLRPVEQEDDALDDEALDLLVDVAAALADVGLPLRQQLEKRAGVSVERWTNWKDERPQANVCWWEGEALMSGRDYQAWRQRTTR